MEGTSLVAGALLFEEDGSPDKDAHEDRSGKKNRRKDHKREEREDKIEDAFVKSHTCIITRLPKSPYFMVYFKQEILL